MFLNDRLVLQLSLFSCAFDKIYAVIDLLCPKILINWAACWYAQTCNVHARTQKSSLINRIENYISHHWDASDRPSINIRCMREHNNNIFCQHKNQSKHCRYEYMRVSCYVFWKRFHHQRQKELQLTLGRRRDQSSAKTAQHINVINYIRPCTYVWMCPKLGSSCTFREHARCQRTIHEHI